MMIRLNTTATRLVIGALAFATASFASAQSWNKGPENPLTITNPTIIAHSQTNNGSSFVYVTPGTWSTSFLQQVTGSTTEDPPWPTWLKPLSSGGQPLSLVYPTEAGARIYPTETYTLTVYYEHQEGSQIWSKPPGGGQGPQTASRARNWNTYTDKAEMIH
ncbi:hypothetical protein BH11ARM2_BH11ARM2_36780 [soil metagenome]